MQNKRSNKVKCFCKFMKYKGRYEKVSRLREKRLEVNIYITNIWGMLTHNFSSDNTKVQLQNLKLQPNTIPLLPSHSLGQSTAGAGVWRGRGFNHYILQLKVTVRRKGRECSS